MKATNKEISEQFSAGNFPFCYDYFADEIEWKLVGNETKKMKENVVAYCNKMMKEMDTSTLTNTNVITEKENIAIEGFCNYTNANNVDCKVEYCDVYRFENDKITSITSYCVEKNV